jgi:hypothetical protein
MNADRLGAVHDPDIAFWAAMVTDDIRAPTAGFLCARQVSKKLRRVTLDVRQT